jgi:uncharacterized membrane protein
VGNLVIPLLLSGSGVVVAALAFVNRDKPDWQRGMTRILSIAVMQVVLGATAWIILSR